MGVMPVQTIARVYCYQLILLLVYNKRSSCNSPEATNLNFAQAVICPATVLCVCSRTCGVVNI